MNIKRNIGGKNITIALSSEELTAAFNEQQHIYDIDDVSLIIEEMEQSGECRTGFIQQLRERIDEIAYEKRRQMNKYDLEWRDAVDEAMRMIVKE